MIRSGPRLPTRRKPLGSGGRLPRSQTQPGTSHKSTSPRPGPPGPRCRTATGLARRTRPTRARPENGRRSSRVLHGEIGGQAIDLASAEGGSHSRTASVRSTRRTMPKGSMRLITSRTRVTDSPSPNVRAMSSTCQVDGPTAEYVAQRCAASTLNAPRLGVSHKSRLFI